MASQRISALLAVEVEGALPTTTPGDVQQLIAAMARANATWGEERIAAELRLKLGLCVSPRTVRCYMPRGGRPRDRLSSQRWSTFVRNHASAILACDFFVTITARFRTLYVFVILDVGTRRIVHWNVTEHPTAEWTVQQFRAIVPGVSTAAISHSRPRQHLRGGRRWRG
jgi:putative transposase